MGSSGVAYSNKIFKSNSLFYLNKQPWAVT